MWRWNFPSLGYRFLHSNECYYVLSSKISTSKQWIKSRFVEIPLQIIIITIITIIINLVQNFYVQTDHLFVRFIKELDLLIKSRSCACFLMFAV